MTTTRGFIGLAATANGRAKQINRGFRGLAADIERRRAGQAVEPDAPQTLDHALRLIAQLRNQLVDAQATIDDLRAGLNSDSAVVSEAMWDTATVARKSGVAISTICRNADKLGGKKLGGDWLFPVGTTYGRRRKL